MPTGPTRLFDPQLLADCLDVGTCLAVIHLLRQETKDEIAALRTAKYFGRPIDDARLQVLQAYLEKLPQGEREATI